MPARSQQNDADICSCSFSIPLIFTPFAVSSEIFKFFYPAVKTDFTDIARVSFLQFVVMRRMFRISAKLCIFIIEGSVSHKSYKAVNAI